MAKNKNKPNRVTEEQKHAFDHPVISWTAPMYLKHEKGRLWYILAIIILLGFVLHAAITEAWTFAVALIAYAYVYFQTHRKAPKEVKVVLSEIGIKEGRHYYPYSNIKAFWIVYHPPFVKQLHIVTNRQVLSEITIQLVDQDPAEVRNFLCTQIPEWEGKEERFIDHLCRTLKI